jgi:ribosomal-protein-alanine N-acetyltransferase
MSIRPAEPPDLERLAEIQRECEESSQWSIASYSGYDLLVAEIQGRVAGFLASRAVADGEYEILNLGIAREFRRRGLAKALLAEALTRRPGTWFLEVRSSNTAARRLYGTSGFREVGVRRKYYSEPVEDAVVMRKGS